MQMAEAKSKKTSASKQHSENSAAPAWEQAYNKIKEQILHMEIKPGEMISELNLAKELGISRTPVREAISRLEQEGLIETENRRKRAYVLRIHEIDEIFDLKKGIEGEIARVATERAEEQQKDQLCELLQAMREFGESHSFENLTQEHRLIKDWLELDEQFHALLFEMASNRRAEQIVRSLNSQWHRLELGLLAMEGRLQRNIEEHLEMGAAIIGGKSEEARVLMVNHLERLHGTIANIMRMFHFPG